MANICVRCGWSMDAELVEWASASRSLHPAFDGVVCSHCTTPTVELNSYRVHMEHWQRRMSAPSNAIFIEHIEVVIQAPSGDAAARASKAILGNEWIVRVVGVESKV